MFDSATKVMKLENAINLFDRKGKLLKHLEKDRPPLHFESSALFVTSELRGDVLGRENFSKAQSTTQIAGILQPRSLNLGCFEGTLFRGQIRTFNFYCSESNEYHLQARVFDPAVLNISIALPSELFREVFHPIWVRQAKGRLNISLCVNGYQDSIETDRDIPGIDNIVIEANSDIGAEMSSIQFTVQLQ